jgi:hypothetical protein
VAISFNHSLILSFYHAHVRIDEINHCYLFVATQCETKSHIFTIQVHEKWM